MNLKMLILVIPVILILASSSLAQEETLIIDPEISGYASIPIRGSKIVHKDSLPSDYKPGPTHRDSFYEKGMSTNGLRAPWLRAEFPICRKDGLWP